MAHAAPWRSRDPGNEADDRLLDIFPDELSGFFFRIATNLAYHHDRLSLWIFLEQRQHIDEACAIDRISSDPDTSRFTQSHCCELIYRFVGEGPTARHDAHDALLMNEARHDADFRFIDCDNTGTVGSDQSDILPTKRALDLDHVVHRNAFSNTDHELDARICRFQDRIGTKRRRHKNERGVALGFLHGIAHRIEHRNAFDLLPRLTRRHTRDDLRSVSLALRRMERAFLPRNPLHHHPRILIHENAHSLLLIESWFDSIPSPLRNSREPSSQFGLHSSSFPSTLPRRARRHRRDGRPAVATYA